MYVCRYCVQYVVVHGMRNLRNVVLWLVSLIRRSFDHSSEEERARAAPNNNNVSRVKTWSPINQLLIEPLRATHG